MKVRKAVIPAAGLGTRFLPATKAIPKEMIPIIDTPMIQYIVQEAVESGIEEIILVTARGKGAIEDHFDYAYELEDTMDKKGKKDLAELSRSLGNLCNLISVRQKTPMGLGHAVLAAAPAVGNEPFAILLGDDLIDARVPCTRQLINVFERTGTSVVGVMEVPETDVSKYGVVGGAPIDDRTLKVDRLVEKPGPGQAPSRLAIPGRYVVVPEIFDHIRSTPPGKGGEIQLTDALAILARQNGLLAYQYDGDRYDTGDRLGYLDATLTFALRRPDLADGVRALLKKHAGRNP